MIKSFLTAGAIALAPTLALATTVVNEDFGTVTTIETTYTTSLYQDNQLLVAFSVPDPMWIDITIAMTGHYDDLTDVEEVVLFPAGGTPADGFDIDFIVLGSPGGLGIAYLFYSGYQASDFVLEFLDGIDTEVGITMTVVGMPVVPLPAGGLLLVSALGGLAALRRRKGAVAA